MTRAVYPSDLSPSEWSVLEPLIPPAKPGVFVNIKSRRMILKNRGEWVDCERKRSSKIAANDLVKRGG